MSHAQIDPQPKTARGLIQITTTIQDACDACVGRLYFPVVCLVLLLMVVFTRWYGRKLAADWEQWVIADWLISYAPGFVRRGLGGEMLLAVSAWSGASANTVVLGIIVGLCATFSVLFAVLLAGKRLTFWYFFLCLSPAFVLFTFYNAAAVGRKEWLIFVAFAAWALVHAWRRVSIGWCAAFAAIVFVLTLMHELVFFFSPYFVLLVYLESRRQPGDHGHTETPRHRGIDWQWALVVPGASTLALIGIVLLSGSLNDPALCERLVGIGAPRAVCGGVFDYPDVPASAALSKALDGSDARTAAGAISAAAIAIAPVVLFLFANRGSGEVPMWRIVGLVAAAFAFSLPLFVLAVDWGRWIAIHTVLLTVTCSVLLERKGVMTPVPALGGRATVAGLIGGTLVIASAFLWTPRYCCGTDMVTPWGPVTAIGGMVEEIEANLAD